MNLIVFIAAASDLRHHRDNAPRPAWSRSRFVYLTGITKRCPSDENSQAGRLCWSEDSRSTMAAHASASLSKSVERSPLSNSTHHVGDVVTVASLDAICLADPHKTVFRRVWRGVCVTTA